MVVEKKKKPYAVIGLPFSIYLLELDDFGLCFARTLELQIEGCHMTAFYGPRRLKTGLGYTLSSESGKTLLRAHRGSKRYCFDTRIAR